MISDSRLKHVSDKAKVETKFLKLNAKHVPSCLVLIHAIQSSFIPGQIVLHICYKIMQLKESMKQEEGIPD